MARRMGRWLVLFLALSAACGDVDFYFVVRTGTVEADADCAGSGGSFGLRDQQGLTVLVVITDDTNIFFASGGSGRCSDVTRDTVAQVQGDEKNGTIEAQSVRLGSA
jgi:hypothetical protein